MPVDSEARTISDLALQLRRKEISPLELTRLYLERAKRLNPLLNAYITLTEEQALADAAQAEREIQQGRYRGPLHGIPFSIKDNLATNGIRTTAGSKILADWVPDFDATAVQRLKDAGAIVLGKTNMHEWALGGTTINPFYGTSRNPWNVDYIAGGSSGGSAAAVAADLCLASIGTDSAQSVRNPASMCGIVGLKPTYGRVSQYGTVAGTGAYSTNHTGILTRAVEDCALVLQAIAGHDPYLRTRAQEYSKPTLHSYISALLTPAATYVMAQRARRIVCDEFDDLLKRVQLLVLPTIGFPVPTVDECQMGYVQFDGKKLPRQDARGGLESLCCIPFNVTGLPAISVCCGFSQSGMPLGLQIVAGSFQEPLIFQAAYAYERLTEWYKRRPTLPV
jgi:Asp-tRNA(Asn)/Glu-tRNA(Gln) amidotransferase A subunit family amidase